MIIQLKKTLKSLSVQGLFGNREKPGVAFIRPNIPHTRNQAMHSWSFAFFCLKLFNCFKWLKM